jgi:hypothetical protein
MFKTHNSWLIVHFVVLRGLLWKATRVVGCLEAMMWKEQWKKLEMFNLRKNCFLSILLLQRSIVEKRKDLFCVIKKYGTRITG